MTWPTADKLIKAKLILKRYYQWLSFILSQAEYNNILMQD